MARTAKNGKPMSPAQRKRAQREREAKLAIKVVEVKLSQTLREALDRNRVLRGGVRGAYDADEYIATLLRRDTERLNKQLATLGHCAHCGEQLPDGCGGVFKGQSECFHNLDYRQLEL